ncbi:PD-(D/E)XK nuclease family protein [Paenibacillus marinisediminis]
MLNTTIQQLYDIMNGNPIERKWLLVSSYAQGHQWLEQITRLHGPVFNTEVRTLESWVQERSRLILARQKLSYLTSSESKWIVCKLLQDMSLSGKASYIQGIVLTPGLTNVFHQAVVELREAGVKAEQLEPRQFEQQSKGVLVKELLTRYEAYLEQHRYVDLARILDYASQLTVSKGVIIVDEHAVRNEIERRLLHILTTGGQCSSLRSLSPEAEQEFILHADSIEFFHANGALAEAREVIRRIMKRDLRVDQVEIIASNYDANVSAIFTAAATTGIPCTYADGLPLGVMNAGKAAKLYLEWLRSGFDLNPILTALKQGVVRFQVDESNSISSALLIHELEQSGIGWGKERYALLEQLAKAEHISEERRAVLSLLQRVFKRLLQPLTEEALNSPSRLLSELIRFVESYVLLDKYDGSVIKQLKLLQKSIGAAGDIVMSSVLALLYIQESVEGIRVQVAATPAPGAIHVTSLNGGGHSGRPYSFIMGMSETNWSLALRQDPVLLDEERARISPNLRLSSEIAARRQQERYERFGMLGGHCTLSYCSYNVADHREYMPAHEMLQAYRRSAAQADADYVALHRAMGEAVRYYRSPTGLDSEATDVWMRALQTEHAGLKSAQQSLYAAYPLLMDGVKAAQARLSASVSPYDGIIDTSQYPIALPGEPGADSDAFSVSKLEQYGRCPLQYYYQEVLGIRAKEVTVYDRTRWLDAMERGSLLHDIFNQYVMAMKELQQASNSPISHDASMLRDITENVIARYADAVPAPSEHIFRKEAESIRKDVQIFLVGERKRASSTTYKETELQLHQDSKPFELALENGISLPLRGIVDRIDEIAPHQYKIYDYKTGKPKMYKQNECFSKGTQLQLPLYGAAVEQWMIETGYDVDAQVVDSAYLFPTERGMGEEVTRSQQRRGDLADLLYHMLEAMREGLYPPASDPIGCAWCNYADVCGSHAEQFQVKLEAPENADRLRHILEVYRYV